MSGRIKRYPRTRTSKQFCEEKFACNGERVEAEYQCDQCNTVQCSVCESKLHQQAKLVSHDRQLLTPPSPEYLCLAAACIEKNFSEVTCDGCKLNYCQPCFDKAHAFGRKRNHKKSVFKLKAELVTDITKSVGLADALEHINVTDFDAIKPTSPLQGSDNDSLTYFSVPQAQLGMSFEERKHQEQSQQQRNSIGTDNSFSSIPEDLSFPIGPSDCFAMDNLTKRDHAVSKNTKEIAMVSPTTKQGLCDASFEAECSSNVNSGSSDFKNIPLSFPLADHNEKLQVEDEVDFMTKLGLDKDVAVKVLSIFGNTGDGKSYTLNHTFFGGSEVFKTSSMPDCCTVGAVAAFDADHKVILIDTEGLLGVTANQNQRTRLLLKVLAVSDIVVYRTRAERLHEDLFRFLGDASRAYIRHFNVELKTASKKLNLNLEKLGPAVLIFHETLHTSILDKGSAIDVLRSRFRDLDLSVEAFSSIDYVGTKTKGHTDFSRLLASIKKEKSTDCDSA